MPTPDNPEKMARLYAWLDAVGDELGIHREVMEEAQTPLLDLINHVAHGPSRPGAPLSAFLVGYAAGRGDAPSPELIEKIETLLETYEYPGDKE